MGERSNQTVTGREIRQAIEDVDGTLGGVDGLTRLAIALEDPGILNALIALNAITTLLIPGLATDGTTLPLDGGGDVVINANLVESLKEKSLNVTDLMLLSGNKYTIALSPADTLDELRG